MKLLSKKMYQQKPSPSQLDSIINVLQSNENLQAHWNMYHLEGLFYCDGGNATQQGATTSITTIESEAGCDLVFDVTGNDVRVRWTGIVAETWNVTGKIEITEVD